MEAWEICGAVLGIWLLISAVILIVAIRRAPNLPWHD